jgi:hypothetical protein
MKDKHLEPIFFGKDCNGVTITEYDDVNVPEPNDTDLHQHEFTGTVLGCRNGYVQVVDGDGDVFEIEPERLEVMG